MRRKTDSQDTAADLPFWREKVRFVVYGEEIIEKTVKPNGNSGSVYIPASWADKKLKIVRMD